MNLNNKIALIHRRQPWHRLRCGADIGAPGGTCGAGGTRRAIAGRCSSCYRTAGRERQCNRSGCERIGAGGVCAPAGVGAGWRAGNRDQRRGDLGPIQRIAESDPAAWLQALLINTIAPYLVCRAFVGRMIAQGWGRIVNVSSAASLDPPGGLNSAYATSKVALNHFTRHLAAELSGSGVTANVIHPGDVKTEMWADIRKQVTAMGPEADGYRNWVQWVEETRSARRRPARADPEADGRRTGRGHRKILVDREWSASSAAGVW